MKVSIDVCPRCNRKTCDGGTWEITKVVRIKDGRDVTREVHSDNLRDCTMRMLGRERKYHGLSVGQEVTRQYPNWLEPSEVTMRKVGG